MNTLTTLYFSEKPILYDGNQLASHWIYKNFNIQGNAIIGFQGPCNVSLEHMVDLEDVKKNAPISGNKMLHFIGEFFIDSLTEGILLQHLFVCGVYEALWENGIRDLNRRGNDVYFNGRKFSVSIATKSLVSVLIHVGMNVETEGTPIPTSGLNEMGLDAAPFAIKVLERFKQDYGIWQAARVKVLPR